MLHSNPRRASARRNAIHLLLRGGVLIMLLFLSSCTTQRFVVNSGAPEEKPREDTAQAFFIGGIGQTQTIDAAQVCGGTDKVARVERQYTSLNWFLAFISFNIYTPYQARVYCLK